jgi:NAD(P)-dependent dehydrogenase (short-subunit alcohol dehydrogenase family)
MINTKAIKEAKDFYECFPAQISGVLLRRCWALDLRSENCLARICSLKTLLAVMLALLFAQPVVTGAASQESSRQKAILVTGASTGIGRKITERLAADGYFVYAGARKDADLQVLGTIRNVQPVRLDVTKAQDIAEAAEVITTGGRGLYALINNAGVTQATGSSFLDPKEDEFDLIMNVNLYGPYRVTKAFAPLIVAQKGRVITIGSIMGIGTLGCVYCMSKHAVEAFTDGLAAEMEPLGVKVSVIEPGGYHSEADRTADMRAGVDPQLGDTSHRKEPDEVAFAAELALFEPSPKRRYLVVPNQAEAELTIKAQIAQLVQLNEGHAYTYNRKALRKMLDEALAHSRPRTQ